MKERKARQADGIVHAATPDGSLQLADLGQCGQRLLEATTIDKSVHVLDRLGDPFPAVISCSHRPVART